MEPENGPMEDHFPLVALGFGPNCRGVEGSELIHHPFSRPGEVPQAGEITRVQSHMNYPELV